MEKPGLVYSLGFQSFQPAPYRATALPIPRLCFKLSLGARASNLKPMKAQQKAADPSDAGLETKAETAYRT